MSRYNFYEEITMDGYSFPTTPQVTFGFLSSGITLLNRGSYIIHYSFNGTDIHGDLDPSDASIGAVFDNRVESSIWFKAVAGFSPVRVEAWGFSGR
jgi:hypothetical protein